MKGLLQITALIFSSATGVAKGNMLMGQTLGEYLSDLVSFDALSMTQMDYILSAADNTTLFDRSSVFATDESKDGLRTYLYAEVSAALMEEETAERIASKLSLGALYPEETLAELEGFVGPVPKVYEGDGNLQRLGSIKTRSTSINSNIFNGIWGLTKGGREYALMCSTWGLEIIDITNPGSPFRVQAVQMSGGLYWRDAATHETSTGESKCCFIIFSLFCIVLLALLSLIKLPHDSSISVCICCSTRLPRPTIRFICV